MKKPELMLAKKISQGDLKKWTNQEWEKVIVEPKIDGVRIVRLPSGKWMSRQGKPLYNLDHLTSRIDSLPLIKTNQYLLDGELFGGDWSLTMSAARSFRKEIKHNNSLILFDMVHQDIDEPYSKRRHRMMSYLKPILSDKIQAISQFEVSSFYEFDDIFDDCINKGCDGVMIKDKEGMYEYKRSKYWLKVKPFDEEDCKIVGFKEGKGKYKGTLGALLVKTPLKNGWSKMTTGVSGMNDTERDYIWSHRELFIGKIVEVEYRKISEKRRLIEPRLRKLRLDKDAEIE